MATTTPNEVDLRELPAGSVVTLKTSHGSTYEITTSGTTTTNRTSYIGGLHIRTNSDRFEVDMTRQGQLEGFALIRVGIFWHTKEQQRTSTVVGITVIAPER